MCMCRAREKWKLFISIQLPACKYYMPSHINSPHEKIKIRREVRLALNHTYTRTHARNMEMKQFFHLCLYILRACSGNSFSFFSRFCHTFFFLFPTKNCSHILHKNVLFSDWAVFSALSFSLLWRCNKRMKNFSILVVASHTWQWPLLRHHEKKRREMEES